LTIDPLFADEERAAGALALTQVMSSNWWAASRPIPSASGPSGCYSWPFAPIACWFPARRAAGLDPRSRSVRSRVTGGEATMPPRSARRRPIGDLYGPV